MFTYLQGMAEIHNMGIVHRDLKCSNILLRWLDGFELPEVVIIGWFPPPTPTHPNTYTPSFLFLFLLFYYFILFYSIYLFILFYLFYFIYLFIYLFFVGV